MTLVPPPNWWFSAPMSSASCFPDTCRSQAGGDGATRPSGDEHWLSGAPLPHANASLSFTIEILEQGIT